MAGLACLAAVALALLLPAAIAMAQPYSIPDSPGPTGTFGPPIFFQGDTNDAATLAGVANVTITMSHTRVGDLRVRLVYTPANGPGVGIPVTVPLFTRVGVPANSPGSPGDDSNMSGTYTFTDGGADAWALLTDPSNTNNYSLPSGSYRAFGSGDAPVMLGSSLAGLSASGTWQFYFDDAAPGNAGSVTSVSFDYLLEPCFPPSSWSGLDAGTNAGVWDLAALPNGDVIVGGQFYTAGGVPESVITRVNPATGIWSPLGFGGTNGQILGLAVLPGGDVVAGGLFSTFTAGGLASNIARVNPTTGAWSALGSGTNGQVSSLAVLPDGEVVAGGVFSTAGGLAASNIARVNPTTGAWSALGLGIIGTVRGLAVLPDGDVVVGGQFDTAGGLAASNIARVNPTTGAWSALGSGINGQVLGLAVLPDGDVVAGGFFSTAGGLAANNIARVNPTTGVWSALGSGTNGPVLGLAVLPDGDVVVGGQFDTAGGVAAINIARVNPATGAWSPLGSGTSGLVLGLAVLPDGDVVAGGVFSTAGGLAASNIARCHFVDDAPVILAQPASVQQVCIPSASASFTVSAMSNATLSYRWRKNTTPINTSTNPSAATATLTLYNPTDTDSGSYDCIVSNSCGSITSDAAVFVRRVPPSIIQHPSSVDVCNGDPATFTVAASGVGPFTYQWRKNSVPIDTATNPSAATAMLMLFTDTIDELGAYDCIVSDTSCSVTSNQAQVIPQFGNWTATILHPAGATLSQAFGAQGGQQAGYVTIGGVNRASLWSGTANSRVDLHPAGAQASLLGGIGTGATGSFEQAGATAIGGGLRAAKWSGTAGSWMDLHPAGATESNAFGVQGGQQVGYAQIAGVNRASIWNGTAASRIDIHPAGTLNSIAYAIGDGLQVGATVTPAGALHAALWSGSAESWVDLHPAEATESNAFGVQGGQQVGYARIAGVNRASIWNGTAASRIDIHPAGTLNSIAYAIGDGFQVGATVTPAGALHAAVWSGTPGSLTDLHDSLPSTYTSSEARGIYSDCNTYVVGWAFNASANSTVAVLWSRAHACTAPPITSQPVSAIACPGHTISFSIVAEGDVTYEWRKNNAAIAGNPSASTEMLTLSDVEAADAGDYTCIVTNIWGCGARRSTAARLTVNVPPSVSQQPVPTVACISGSAAFSVTAVGGGPYTYAWWKDGNPINATTNPSAATAALSLSNVQSGDAGSYDCVVTNICGSVTSNTAMLTVNEPPSVSHQPVPTDACISGSAMFSVTPAGTGPFSYQWRRNETPISTTTNPSAATAALNLSNVQSGDAGSYDCVVTNICGSTTSMAATLTICSADFNCSGDVTVPDIFAFLATWFAQGPGSDFDGSGTIAVPDIFAFLAAWFAGCP